MQGAVDGVVERIDRGLRVARGGQLARQRARIRAQGLAVIVEERRQQAQHRAPALHFFSDVVHGGRGLAALVFQDVMRLGQQMARDRAQAVADRLARPQDRRLAHG